MKKNKINIEKILDFFIEFSLLVLVFAVPLYFGVFFETANFFISGKVFIFRVFTILMLVATVLRYTYSGYCLTWAMVWAFVQRYVFVFLLFGWMAMSTFWSIDRTNSLFGLIDRQEGLISQVYYLLFFVLIAVNSRTISIRRIFWSISLSSMLVSLYGILQYLGIDFIQWTESALLARVSSTLGQPNYLGAFLLLVIPISSYLFIRKRKEKIAYLLAFIVLVNIVCLLLTASRGAWLGFVLGLIVSGSIVFFVVSRKTDTKKIFREKRSVIAVVLMVIVLGVVAMFHTNDRLLSSFDLSTGSVASRINFWQASLHAITERPMFGYGLENQGIVFSGYYEKSWAIHGDLNVYPNRAHNVILDTLLTVGLVGSVFYILLLVYLVRIGLRNLGSQFGLRGFFLIWAITAYLIYLLTGFVTLTDSMYFWLFMAILAMVLEPLTKEPRVTTERRVRAVIAVLVILVAILIVRIEFRDLTADYYHRQSVESFQIGKQLEALLIYREMENVASRPEYYQAKFAELTTDHFDQLNSQFIKVLYGNELERIQIRLERNTSKYRKTLAKVYTQLARNDGKYWDQAEEKFQSVIRENPEIVRNHLELGKMYLAKGDFDQAQISCREGLEQIPDIRYTAINDRHLAWINIEKNLLYKCLGLASMEMGDYEVSRKYYRQALLYDVYDLPVYKKLSEIMYLQNDLDNALWYSQRGAMLSPDDWSWPLAIALLYEEMGDEENYELYMEEARDLGWKGKIL